MAELEKLGSKYKVALRIARDARFEQKARGVGMHALGLSFNVGVGIAAYALHRRLWSVVSATVVGGLVGEARIWTTPTVATEAWSHYRSGRLVDAKLAWSPVIVPQPGGATLGLSGSF